MRCHFLDRLPITCSRASSKRKRGSGASSIPIGSGTHAINPSIYSKMPFKGSDFAPITIPVGETREKE